MPLNPNRKNTGNLNVKIKNSRVKNKDLKEAIGKNTKQSDHLMNQMGTGI